MTSSCTARPWPFLFVRLVRSTERGGGTRLAQTSWLPVLRTLGARTFSGNAVYVAKAGEVFDAEGKLVDSKVEKILTQFMAGFAELIGR